MAKAGEHTGRCAWCNEPSGDYHLCLDCEPYKAELSRIDKVQPIFREAGAAARAARRVRRVSDASEITRGEALNRRHDTKIAPKPGAAAPRWRGRR